jgi:hypothetical protein
MTARTATDKRPVSLTKRQWHLIVREWQQTPRCPADASVLAVMDRAVPLIVSYCDAVKSPDDIVAVPGSLSGWQTVVAFCDAVPTLQWNVLDDIEKQIKVYSHGG